MLPVVIFATRLLVRRSATIFYVFIIRCPCTLPHGLLFVSYILFHILFVVYTLVLVRCFALHLHTDFSPQIKYRNYVETMYNTRTGRIYKITPLGTTGAVTEGIPFCFFNFWRALNCCFPATQRSAYPTCGRDNEAFNSIESFHRSPWPGLSRASVRSRKLDHFGSHSTDATCSGNGRRRGYVNSSLRWTRWEDWQHDFFLPFGGLVECT